ncbi:MAG: hypothetical protein HYW70_02055 [Candidatus Nealsonbacteria bacterium]|nr:hypothetical protein [Candidatus Nealsonbacteria bacterium]
MFHETILNQNIFQSSRDVFLFLRLFLVGKEFQAVIFPVKIIFIASGVFFFAIIIFSIFGTSWFNRFFLEYLVEFFTYKPYGLKRATKEWQSVLKRLETPSEAEYKLSIIEADNLLNDTLERLKYPGETLEKRLEKISGAVVSNVKDAIEAHKIRNSIVHDPDYRLTVEGARKILETYEKSLRELEVI